MSPRVEIELTGGFGGGATIRVDGTDITGLVEGFTLHVDPTERQLIVAFRAEHVNATVDGIPVTRTVLAADVADEINTVVSGIDPGRLEQRALELAGTGLGGLTMGEAWLGALSEILTGETNG